MKSETLDERNGMKTEQTRPRSLRAIELEVEAEGREWTRQRLQERLQEEANRHGGVFPPERTAVGPSAPAADATEDGGGSDRTRSSPRAGSGR